MGQQQLFIVILVTIILGIATLVAINVLTESRDAAAKEAVILDLLKAVPEARAYYRKPEQMGGGGGSFLNIEFADLATLQTSSENGEYTIKERSQESFKLVGSPVGNSDSVVVVIYLDSITWE